MDDKLNGECYSCPLRSGCHVLVAFNPDDVLEPPCGKYVIGLCGNCDDASYWTRPIDHYKKDPMNPAPNDLKFVV